MKTIYVTRAKGRPKKRHRAGYEPKSVMVEERIVLLKARSHDEAIRRAEEEARRYVQDGTRTNPYGQEVSCSYSGVADSHEMFADKIGSGTEVFSATRVLAREPSTEGLADLFLGPDEGDDGQRRLKFLNSEFSGLL